MNPGGLNALLIAAVALPSLAQFVCPEPLTLPGRHTAQITAHGQVRRRLTSVVVQDSGWPGTLLNLAGLVITVPLAERVWGGPAARLAFLLGGQVERPPSTSGWTARATWG